MATIGSLAVNIVAKTDKFLSGLNNARNMLGKFRTGITLASSLVSAGIGGMLRKFESTGSQLNDLSAATGIAVENLSFLKYAAEQSGAGIEAITKASRELQAKGIDPNQFIEIATAISKIENPTTRALMAFQKFGKKGGAALLPMLKDLPKLQQRFNQLGGGFTGKMAVAADALGDSFGDLKLSLASIGNEISMHIAPLVQQLSDYIAENTGSIKAWIESHGPLIQSFAIVVATLSTAIPVLYGINTAIGVLATTLKGLQLVSALLAKNPVILALLSLGIAGAVIYKGAQALNQQSTGGASGEWDASAPTPSSAGFPTAQANNGVFRVHIVRNDAPPDIGTVGMR